MPLALAILLACTATDGDTLNCGGERVRLLGIDAPDLHGCRQGRQCVVGDGEAARQAIARLIGGAALRIGRVGHDSYGRTLAVVYADGANASCAMIAAGHAVYRRDWDNGGRVALDCPETAL
ncbi:thermonuclease family protein [Alteraurantiacibacter buctensis]|nr:thermonuclease family protein [Alteraurantiacibacter buctensis]